jgi:O-methyltransferase domain
MPSAMWRHYHPRDAGKCGAIFNEAMTSLTGVAADAVARAYQFSDVTKIADVGGGHGLFLSKILRANPHANGVLFDPPTSPRERRSCWTTLG